MRLCLPRLTEANRPGAILRALSPCGGRSILITWAPSSTRFCVKKGPGSSSEKSSTRRPCKGSEEEVDMGGQPSDKEEGGSAVPKVIAPTLRRACR